MPSKKRVPALAKRSLTRKRATSTTGSKKVKSVPKNPPKAKSPSPPKLVEVTTKVKAPNPTHPSLKVTKVASAPPRKRNSNQPSWADMITDAIQELGQRYGGHSISAIKKQILKDNEDTNPPKIKLYLKRGMKAAIEARRVVRVKGTGLNGSFKLAPKK